MALFIGLAVASAICLVYGLLRVAIVGYNDSDDILIVRNFALISIAQSLLAIVWYLYLVFDC